MNVTPFLGSGVAPQLSDNNDAMGIIAANPLDQAMEMKGISREINFDLLSLTNDIDDDQELSAEPDLVALQPVLPNIDAIELPETVLGDKKQNLLAHLLNIAEDVPAATAIHRPAPIVLPESVVAEAVVAPLSLGADIVAKEAANTDKLTTVLSATVATTGLTRHADAEIAVKPQFFAQALLNKESTVVDKSSVELSSAFSVAVKSLADSGEGVKSALNQHNSQIATNQSVGHDNQFSWSAIKLRGSQQQMSEQLHSVLRERLQIQTDSRVQQATIRLDPPNLGKIDISLHIDAGKLNIQINASQSDVYRSLQQMSNELRQHLTEQNFLEVNVQVSSDNSQQGQDRRDESFDEDNILTAREIETSGATKKHDNSILTTV